MADQKQWQKMTAEERLESRIQGFLNPRNANFENPEAQAAYQARVNRLINAIQLKKKPDRIPVYPLLTFLPAHLAGITYQDAMYDYGKTMEAWRKYVYEYEPDAYAGPFLAISGKLLDIIQYKMYRWPGRGVSERAPYQCVEGEYMKAEEYDDLINDPSDFFLRTYLPRIIGGFAGFRKLRPFSEIIEITSLAQNLIYLGMPEVQETLETLIVAGKEAMAWLMELLSFETEVRNRGFVSGAGGMSGAPFDVLGDTLRGTHAIMMDMYRRPEKILQAVERLVPIMIRRGVKGATATGNPLITLPLHKGADSFMSDAQFQKFYWPTLKKVILGLIEEGCVPMPFAEGSYNLRLKYLAELPPGKTAWFFDQTDMVKAKEAIGDRICLIGNVPSSLMISAEPRKVEEYCQHLIEKAGQGGGFIMANGSALDEAKPENLRAMIEYTKKNGKYS